MAIAPVVTDISALAVGQFVVEFSDPALGVKYFANKESGAYTILDGTGLPQVAVVTPIQIQDAPGGPQKIGSYRVTLQAGPGAVTATSPSVYVVTGNATFVTNATAN